MMPTVPVLVAVRAPGVPDSPVLLPSNPGDRQPLATNADAIR